MGRQGKRERERERGKKGGRHEASNTMSPILGDLCQCSVGTMKFRMRLSLTTSCTCVFYTLPQAFYVRPLNSLEYQVIGLPLSSSPR